MVTNILLISTLSNPLKSFTDFRYSFFSTHHSVMVSYLYNNELFLINTNPIHSRRDFLPAVEPDSFQTDTSTCCSNTLILYICSVLQYTCSIYFLFFHVFFLAPNRPQHIHSHVLNIILCHCYILYLCHTSSKSHKECMTHQDQLQLLLATMYASYKNCNDSLIHRLYKRHGVQREVHNGNLDRQSRIFCRWPRALTIINNILKGIPFFLQ